MGKLLGCAWGLGLVLLLSEVVMAMPEPTILVQQGEVASTEETRAAALLRALREGLELYRQGTAESLRQAIEKWEVALPLLRELGDREKEALTLVWIGFVYSALGDRQKALAYYEQALPLYQAIGDRAGEATTLNNIGAVYDDLGEKQQALEHYEQSLPLRRAVGDRAGEATTLNNIGIIYYVLGERQRALEYYEQSLPLSQAVGDRALEATTLNNIGAVYSALGEKQKALEYYEQALSLRQTVGNRVGIAATFASIGVVYSDLGEKQRALEYLEQALPLSQAVGDRAGEATTLHNIGAVYSDLGEKQKALEYLEQALPLFQAVGNRAGVAATLSNIAWIERDLGNLQTALTHIQSAIDIIEDLRTKIGSQELRASFFAQNQSGYEFYIELLMALHYQNPDGSYDGEALHISERARARGLLELLTEANADVRQGVNPELLERESTLQHQLNTADTHRTQLLKGQYTQTELDAVKQEIDNLLAQLQTLEGQIRANRPLAPKTLAVLADPVFSCLGDDRIANSPACNTTETTDSPFENPIDAITQNPTRAAEFLNNACTNFDRLKYTQTEAESILALVPESQSFQATGFDASRATATSNELANYQIVHLATHGCVGKEHPSLHGIVLSLFDADGTPQDGFLRLQDIFNLTLPAELVVLSACQTGIGDNVKGEGIVGLTRGFMYACAKRVAVSLWSVNDYATSALMEKFYQQMLDGGLTATAAMRAAQLEMMRAGKPAYEWAAFVVQGEWRQGL